MILACRLKSACSAFGKLVWLRLVVLARSQSLFTQMSVNRTPLILPFHPSERPFGRGEAIIISREKVIAEAYADPDLQSMKDCMPDEESKRWHLRHVKDFILTRT